MLGSLLREKLSGEGHRDEKVSGYCITSSTMPFSQRGVAAAEFFGLTADDSGERQTPAAAGARQRC